MYSLDIANANLKALHPTKHVPILMEDVEKVYSRNLFSVNADAKTVKGVKRGFLTGILYLAPARLSGMNLCPGASPGCVASCLFFAGKGAFYSVARGRMIKTLAFLHDKRRFIDAIRRSVAMLERKAARQGLKPVVRLNGTSDIAWETLFPMGDFPHVQFYDYTKLVQRMHMPLPANYHLTFSLSETNEAQALSVLASGGVVAAVFGGGLPKTWLGYSVTNADKNDLRFLDRPSTIAGLYPKAKAKRDETGFSIKHNARKAA